MQEQNAETVRRISREVARWLKGQGITQGQAAKMLGLSRGRVSNQLCNEPFSEKTALHWSKALGLNAHFLLTGQGVITNRESGYGKVVRENESLRTMVKTQESQLNAALAELERYREVYGPLPLDN